ncbi:hypothetical protein SLA2020_126950 [Shorea laevis]
MVTLYHRPHRLLLDSPTSAPPANGSRSRASLTNEASFDTNMVIILAALLCALICALGLNSIVRCALRCSRRFAFGAQDETATRPRLTGLKRSTLRQIPVAVYGSGVNVKATECTICLGEFVEGEKVRVLPKCSHGFHVRCVDPWLLEHSSCPTCRQPMEVPPSSSTSDDTEADGGIRQHGNATGAQADVGIAGDEVG